MSILDELSAAARNYDVPLSSSALQSAKSYIDLLYERNAQVNLTAETDPEELYMRHLADGFPAAAYLKRSLGAATPRLADLGSGGGFIGFAIKLAWPEAEVTLIEAVQRKYDFLNIAAVRSGIKGLRVVKARAGAQPAPGGYDAVVERALAPLPQAVAIASTLLKPEGLFLAYQSDPPDPSEPALEKALVAARARFIEITPYRLPRESRDRCLFIARRLNY